MVVCLWTLAHVQRSEDKQARALPIAFPLVGDGLSLLLPTACGSLVGPLGGSFSPFPIYPLMGMLGSQVGDLSLSVFIQSGDPN